MRGLLAGNYFLIALGNTGAPVLYDGLPCGPDNNHLFCDVTTGTPVSVTLGELTPGIDFTFPQSSPGQCIPTAARLCLNESRFEVEMRWETQFGTSGQAAAMNLLSADDSGYFYFFNPNNVEVMVKVLDACGTAFDSFWVFAAGLTDLRVELTVTDTVSGEVRVYTNPQRTPFQPILDTRAFRTCDAVAPSGLGAVPHGRVSAPALWPGLLAEGMTGRGEISTAVAQLPEALPVVRSQAVSGGEGCVPDGLAICLQGSRFKVEADYRTAQGGTTAVGEPLTDDTGVFFFFSRDNAEVVVKVLSNCGGPTNRFWVFAAGLTNVQVTLRVTDTLTGVVQTYFNPLGEAFQPIQDIMAFDTCGAT